MFSFACTSSTLVFFLVGSRLDLRLSKSSELLAPVYKTESFGVRGINIVTPNLILI